MYYLSIVSKVDGDTRIACWLIINLCHLVRWPSTRSRLGRRLPPSSRWVVILEYKRKWLVPRRYFPGHVEPALASSREIFGGSLSLTAIIIHNWWLNMETPLIDPETQATTLP